MPDYAEAHTNRALAWLQLGDFEQGWREYEWRWQTRDFTLRKFAQPRWDGGPLEGKTILLSTEQGLGDTIQFIRYAPLLRQRGATVVMEAPKALMGLLRSCDGIDQLLAQGSPLPDFDVQCPLLSLPALFNTRVDSVPARVPYLRPEPERLRQWGEQVRAMPGFKIGIAWQGSTRYQDDRFRSIPLKHFGALAQLPGVRLVSLQKGQGSEQLKGVPSTWRIEDFGRRVDESGGAFLDTAAVLAHLDLVVTSDTSLAHLAGALAAPVWVALGHAADWRWMVKREDCPWYPTMRLFRQKKAGDWDELFARIAEAIRSQRPAEPVIRNGETSGPKAAQLRKEGAELCRQGKFSEAIGCLRQALQLQPDSPPTLNNLGVALVHVGQLHEAARAYEEALRLRPSYPEALHNLGEAHQKQGKLSEAIRYYLEALALKPHSAQTHNNLGVVLLAQDRVAEAIACCRKALEHEPGFTLAHQNLAVALEKQGKRAEAREHYHKAIEHPGRPAAEYARWGRERAEQGKPLEAAACLDLAVRLMPEDGDSQFRLGQVLGALGEHEQARAALEQALRLRPNDADVLHELANACRRMGVPKDAEPHYVAALRIRPNDSVILNHLGIGLLDQGRLTEAEAAFRTSCRHNPGHASAYNNLGVVLEQQRRVEDSIRAYEEAIRLQPDNPETHRNRALMWLMCGNFEQGWPEYEWRWKCGNAVKRTFTQPRWDGGPLEGKTILLWSEQGLGDTIQFVRYAPLLRQRGATVFVEAPPQLLPLLRRCEGIDRLLPYGGPLPDFDVQCPMLSLPTATHTSVNTVPARVPYFSPDPERLRQWSEHLRAVPGFKIGIAWQGSARYAGDKHRSIALKHFAPLAQLPSVRLVSLQKGHGSEQLAAVASSWPIVDLGRELDEAGGAFMDTAAILAELDLVVTSDTSLAHLAGALGVSVWMALAQASDWRWLLDREDCPWYPTMRLFRQRQFGDWDEVFGRIAETVRPYSFHRPVCAPAACGSDAAR